MKKIIKPAKIEITCDITGKSVDGMSLERELDACYDPSHLELNLMTRESKKSMKTWLPSELGKKWSEITEKEIQDAQHWDILHRGSLDLHPQVAYEVYKFLKRKYPDVVNEWIGADEIVVDPSSL